MKNVKTFAILSIGFSIIGGYLFIMTFEYRLISKILLGFGTLFLFMTIFYALKTKKNKY